MMQAFFPDTAKMLEATTEFSLFGPCTHEGGYFGWTLVGRAAASQCHHWPTFASRVLSRRKPLCLPVVDTASVSIPSLCILHHRCLAGKNHQVRFIPLLSSYRMEYKVRKIIAHMNERDGSKYCWSRRASQHQRLQLPVQHRLERVGRMCPQQ
jgi:hypothetical protein